MGEHSADRPQIACGLLGDDPLRGPRRELQTGRFHGDTPPGFLDEEVETLADPVINLVGAGDDRAVDGATEHRRISRFLVGEQPLRLDRDVFGRSDRSQDGEDLVGSAGHEPGPGGCQSFLGRTVRDDGDDRLGRDPVGFVGRESGADDETEQQERREQEENEASRINGGDEVPPGDHESAVEHIVHAAPPAAANWLSSISRAAASPAMATKAS